MPGILPFMEYGEFARAIERHAAAGEVRTYGEVVENGRPYPLFELVVPGEPWVIVTTGFHGEERSGPLTIRDHFPALAATARALGVGLRVFACINPSGFEAGRRYNASGERPNNDLLRYEVTPGDWHGELAPGESFLQWRVHDEGPKETRALRARLEELPAPAAALDIHQDHHFDGGFVYAYTFGPPDPFRPMIEASAAHAQVLRSAHVDEHHHTDADGLIAAHDGSVTDYYLRRGVPLTAALETTTDLPLERSQAVNLTWIRGFLAFAAGQRGR